VNRVSVELAYDQFGEAGPPVVILHGLLGSARNWTSIGKELAGTHRVFALDLRNHGRSPWAATMSFDDMAGDVAAFIEARGLGPVALLGHSLGGKVAMRLALTRPELALRLVVVDVAPVAYPNNFGRFIAAMHAVDLAAVERRADADLQLQSAVPDPVLRNFLLQNLAKTDGGFVWRVNLEALAANMPELVGFPVPAKDATYPGPTLFIAGGRSRYVQPEHRPLIDRLFPTAELVVIAGAGHWPHAERPAEFLAHLRGFLD
jgi:pimeloyl-ACP methyl ester carboxylesterase